ncbi:hypothetical protein C482_03714 [Natrialba chahannaoensis JCM 10990]|uniref:Uncharacterized protein n=1 Tax=Natrialba chahannaoensis JCM 10990 TaxID=1227492 RepID=M0AYF1_9EURY|nr:hypothetical protein [Natrialba chahannaoensis]ELZ03510.1 hypothetical protein C482_03714 [Natrialba chahannaoensis JCM 10990]
MANHHRNGGGLATRIGQLDIVTSLMLMILAVVGLFATGLMGEVQSLVETHEWVPVTGTLLALVLVFATSETQDPSQMEIWEMGIVAVSVLAVVDASFSALGYVNQYLGAHEPWTSVLILVILILAGAVLSQ